MQQPNKKMKYLGKDMLANKRSKGPGGSQAALLGEAHDKDSTVYMRVDTCVGNRYGAMHRDELIEFIEDNKHAFKIIPTRHKKKFYLEYDHVVPYEGQAPEETQRAFEELQARALAVAERIRGSGRAILSGSWEKKRDQIKYSRRLMVSAARPWSDGTMTARGGWQMPPPPTSSWWALETPVTLARRGSCMRPSGGHGGGGGVIGGEIVPQPPLHVFI
jgi:hypothetical protein